jgi:hypothetical protein
MEGFIISERRRELLKGDSLTALFWLRARTYAARISSSFAEANVLASSVLLLIRTIASISPSWESSDACQMCACKSPEARHERGEPLGGATLALYGVIQRFYQSRD